MAKSTKQLKEETKRMRKYLDYNKRTGKKSVSWSKWLETRENKTKKIKEIKSAGGSKQTKEALSSLSGSDYEEVMNRFYRKKK